MTFPLNFERSLFFFKATADGDDPRLIESLLIQCHVFTDQVEFQRVIMVICATENSPMFIIMRKREQCDFLFELLAVRFLISSSLSVTTSVLCVRGSNLMCYQTK